MKNQSTLQPLLAVPSKFCASQTYSPASPCLTPDISRTDVFPSKTFFILDDRSILLPFLKPITYALL